MADYIDREELLKRIDEVSKSIDFVADDKYVNKDWIAGQRMRLENVKFDVEHMPSVDAVEVVRCKDCKHHKYGLCFVFSFEGKYEDFKFNTEDDFFCKWGEKE